MDHLTYPNFPLPELSKNDSNEGVSNTLLHSRLLRQSIQRTLQPQNSIRPDQPRALLNASGQSDPPCLCDCHSHPNSQPPLSTWTYHLPSDVIERIAVLACSNAPVPYLLALAQSSYPMRQAVAVGLMNNTLTLDEQTLPQVAHWASVFFPFIHHLNILTNIHLFNTTVILPPILQLLQAPSLKTVTMPPVLRFLRTISHAPAITSLTIYLHSTNDAYNLLRLASTPLAKRLLSLRLHCTGTDSHFAFQDDEDCPLEVLSDREEVTESLGSLFPSVQSLHVFCHHHFTSGIWKAGGEFENLKHLSVDTKCSIPEAQIKELQEIPSIALANVPDSLALVPQLSSTLVKLELVDDFLNTNALKSLHSCAKLRELHAIIEEGAESALLPLASRLQTLALQWHHTQCHPMARLQSEWKVADGPVLLKFMKGASQLSTLHLKYARLDAFTLRAILHEVGGTLKTFVTSLIGHDEPEEVRLLMIMRAVERSCVELRELELRELWEGPDYDYSTCPTEGSKNVLENSLRNLRWRRPLLCVKYIEGAVMRMCI